MTSRLVALSLFLAVACLLPAADKADGIGGVPPDRNNVNLVVKNLPTEWSVAKGKHQNVKWVAEVGTRGYVAPAIAGGKIYVATNNGKPRDPKIKGARAVLMCFNEADGKFLWQITHDMPPPDVVTQAKDDGLLSTPTVVGDRLWYLAPASELVCARADGKVLWTYDMMKELKVHPCYVSFCAPVVAGDLVFVVTGNGRVGGDDESFPEPDAPSFVAVHKDTGKLVWKDNSPGKNVMQGQWASPAYAVLNGKPQIIFPGGDGWLYSFEPATGKLIWKFDANPKGSVFKHGKGDKSYLLTPVVHNGKVYTTIGQDPENGADVGHLWCIDPTKTGDISAELEPGKANPNSGVVWHFGGKAPPGGTRDFHFARSISAPVVHDGLVYAVDLDGFFYCLDAATGKPLWEEDLKAAVWGTPFWVDGKVYLGDDQAFVHVFAHGRTKKLLNKVEMEEPMKASLTAANGTLYILGDKHLYAIAGK